MRLVNDLIAAPCVSLIIRSLIYSLYLLFFLFSLNVSWAAEIKSNPSVVKRVSHVTVASSESQQSSLYQKIGNPIKVDGILGLITPTLVYCLVLLGVYGIFFELLHPGLILPGLLGVLSILFFLYALPFLAINYAALALIGFGILLIIAELFVITFGLLALGGTIAFVIGSTSLMVHPDKGQQIALAIIWLMALINILIFILLGSIVIKSRKQKLKNGLQSLIGLKGRALSDIHQQGQAIIRGEIWSVVSKLPIVANKNIKVIKTSGLVLEVEEEQST